MRLEQVPAEQIHEVLEAAFGPLGHDQPQFFADGEQELRRRHARVEDERDLGVFGRLGEQRTNYGGLARADLARELDEATRLVDAVHQVRQGFRVPFREEQVARVGGDREGLLVESEKGGVHGYQAAGGWSWILNVRRRSGGVNSGGTPENTF